ncbi:hypothetical protein [Neptunomonas marina]|uniref:Uncharacterized protein n=1 Tax=Neptunomonas marina TaxID=1815562 RepID=A0A437Q639_9GAMM|nr:hypothetical protein [Neptunomonas marina]RVU29965.1 hypothetical protein EOE65_12940 [Neptunomonas marina]
MMDVKCKECHGSVDTKAKFCSHCGVSEPSINTEDVRIQGRPDSESFESTQSNLTRKQRASWFEVASTVFCWIFGVLFFLLGLLCLVVSLQGALLSFLAAALLLPPIRNKFYNRTNITIKPVLRLSAILFLFIGVIFFMIGQGTPTEYANPEDPELLTSENNSPSPEMKDYPATEATEAEEIEKRKNQLLLELRGIPASQYAQNEKKYNELVNLFPDNTFFLKKRDFYRSKRAEKEAKQLVKEGDRGNGESRVNFIENYTCKSGYSIMLRHIDDKDFIQINGTGWLPVAEYNDWSLIETVYENNRWKFRDQASSRGLLLNVESDQSYTCKWTHNY